MIVPQGTINTAGLVVPDLYVQIVPPQTLLIAGTPTNVIGVVGTASWGPVNAATTISDMPSYARIFGAPVARKFDMGTHVATAIQQGANAFRCVRVTDGTDTAAASTGVASAITFAAKYTGSAGNNLTIQLSTGSKTSSWKVIVGVPGGQPELFDNVSGTGNTFWVNLASAINNGANVVRGPSQLVVATTSSGSTAPSAQTFTFSGGTDGVAAIATTNLIGQDTAPRTGIYALRSQGCSIMLVSDCDDSTKWTTIDQMVSQEGIYAIQTGPSGDSISNAITTKQTAGLDSYSSKLMLGDWILWSDPFIGIQRWISPQGFVAGRIGNLSPEQSSLNKTLYSVVSSQRSAGTSATYSSAELAQLEQAGIDVIANPGAGGIYIWTVRIGHNSSSNSSINGDNYTRLTNFIATSLNAGMGLYIGKPINSGLQKGVNSTLNSFFLGMLGQGMLGIDVDDGGLPFNVVCGLGIGSNNPPARTKLGFFQADVQVQYMAINEKFIVNIEGGQTVTVTRQTLSTGQIVV